MATVVWLGNKQVDLDHLSQQDQLALYYQLSVAKGVAHGAGSDFISALESRQQAYSGLAKDAAQATQDINGYGSEASWFTAAAQGIASIQTAKGGVDVAAVAAKHNPETAPLAEAWGIGTKLGDAANSWSDGHSGKSGWKLLELVAPELVPSGLKDGLKASMKIHQAAYEGVTGDTEKAVLDGLSAGAKITGQKLVDDGVSVYKGLNESQKGVAHFMEASAERDRLQGIADHGADFTTGIADTASYKAEHVSDMLSMVRQGQDPSTDYILQALSQKLPDDLINKDALENSIKTIRDEALIQANKAGGGASFDTYSASVTDGGGGSSSISAAVEQAEKHADHADASDQKSQGSAQGAEHAAQESDNQEQRGLASSHEAQDHTEGAHLADGKSQEAATQANTQAGEAQDSSVQAGDHAQTADQQLADATGQAQHAAEQGQAATEHASDSQAQLEQSQDAAGQAEADHNESENARGVAGEQGTVADQSAEGADSAHGQGEDLLAQIQTAVQGCGTACEQAGSHQNEAEQSAGEAEQALAAADGFLQQIHTVMEQSRSATESLQQTLRQAEDLRQQIQSIRDETDRIQEETQGLQDETAQLADEAGQISQVTEASAQTAEQEMVRASAAASRAEAVL